MYEEINRIEDASVTENVLEEVAESVVCGFVAWWVSAEAGWLRGEEEWWLVAWEAAVYKMVEQEVQDK